MLNLKVTEFRRTDSKVHRMFKREDCILLKKGIVSDNFPEKQGNWDKCTLRVWKECASNWSEWISDVPSYIFDAFVLFAETDANTNRIVKSLS